MELNESNRIVAAILTAGLLHHTRETFSDKHAVPGTMDAVTMYAQCLSWLTQRQQQGNAQGYMYY